MRIVIVGAGEVGSNIAASLADDHDIAVIDVDPERVDDLTYSLDVLAIEGDGAAYGSLREAGIEEADILIASTDDDETNLVTCATAKTAKDVFTIARVRNANYIETWDQSEGAFGVDFMVSTNLLTATDIAEIISLPAALDVDQFAGGLVQMAEFEIFEGSPLANQTIKEADRFDSLTFAAIVQRGDVTIPKGETVIEAGDRVVVIGQSESVQRFAAAVKPPEVASATEDVVIVGGSDIGYHTARLLEERGYQPRLIEQDGDRARQLAEELTETVVMNHDATDFDFLVGEHVDRADAVIAALGNDEKNLLVSLLAKTIGTKRTVAVVEDGEYTDLFEAVGVDVAINPREVTAEEIIRFAQEGQIENLSLIENRQAEVLEIQVSTESILANKPIREVVNELPTDVVIGAITRQREFIIPRGDTVIEPGDHVVLFVAADVLNDVTRVV